MFTNDSELAEFASIFSVDDGEARPPEVTTESGHAESCGKFTVEIGEARPPKKANFQIVDMPGPQLHEDIVNMPGPHCHEDMAEAIQLAPQVHFAERIGFARKSAPLSPNGPEVFQFQSGYGSSLHPLPR